MVEAVAASSAAARDPAAASSPVSTHDSAAGAPLGSLVLLQHPPVYTLGTGATEGHLKFDAAAAPLPLYRTERGGEVTYHGPGQLVLYPILDLRRPPLQADLHWYLRQLEEVAVRALDAVSGLKGERVPGLTGVWVGGAKVAAIGVRASRWVTYHGLALNVATDLAPFASIVPCGIADRPVASVQGLLTQQQQQQQQPQPEQQQLWLEGGQQQQQQQQVRLQDEEGASSEAWEDPLAAAFAPDPAAARTAAAIAAAASRQAAEDALLAEYGHGLLAAFEEVFGVELQPAAPADMASLLGSAAGNRQQQRRQPGSPVAAP